jgi:hypothetical protein
MGAIGRRDVPDDDAHAPAADPPARRGMHAKAEWKDLKPRGSGEELAAQRVA